MNAATLEAMLREKKTFQRQEETEVFLSISLHFLEKMWSQ